MIENKGVPLRSDVRLRFRADACLPRRFPAIACQRCADVCPSEALVPTPNGPQLSSGCTDCGQCVTRCPTEALAVPGFGPARVPAAHHETAPVNLDCWRVASHLTPAGGLRVPCLGGLSPAWLLELVANAAGRPVHLLDRGLCGGCPSGQPAPDGASQSLRDSAIGHWSGPGSVHGPSHGARPAAHTASQVPSYGVHHQGSSGRPSAQSDERAHAFHPARWCLVETLRLLDGIGFNQHRWPRLISASGANSDGTDSSHRRAEPYEPASLGRPEPLLETALSRRAFFTGRTRGRADPPAPRDDEEGHCQAQVSRQDQAQPEQARRLAALLRLVPAQQVPAHLFAVLAITDACAHHGLCASACPSGALSQDRREGEQGHRFNPSACSACGLCVQLCPEQAIELQSMGTRDLDSGALATAAQTLTRFSTYACSTCGADIPVAAARADKPGVIGSSNDADADRPGGTEPNNEADADALDANSLSADTHEIASEHRLCPACARDQDLARSAFQTLFAHRAADT